MTFRSKATVLGIAAALFAVADARAQEPDPRGYWITEFRKARVNITTCGKSLCGIVMMKPDDESREVPTKILIDMVQDGPNKWRGSAFNPEDRSIYRASMWFESETRLTVEGCAMTLCRRETWTRSKIGNPP